jgi:hypothetical protein
MEQKVVSGANCSIARSVTGRCGDAYVLLAGERGGGARQLREHVALLRAVGGEAQQFVEQELHRIAARLVQVGLRALLTVWWRF